MIMNSETFAATRLVAIVLNTRISDHWFHWELLVQQSVSLAVEYDPSLAIMIMIDVTNL